MINVPELGSTRDGSAGASHGEKLAAICRLIQSVSDDDQAIVFVPNEDDIDIVTEALEEHDISHHAVSKSRRDAADIIDDFQKNSDPEERKRVLVLNLGDESAAGV
jgi:SNF2 family DNA or RNA helicase